MIVEILMMAFMAFLAIVMLYAVYTLKHYPPPIEVDKIIDDLFDRMETGLIESASVDFNDTGIHIVADANAKSVKQEETDKSCVWIAIDGYDMSGHKCSHCGKITDFAEDYCPGCGYKSKGVTIE